MFTTEPNKIVCKLYKSTTNANYEQVTTNRLSVNFMAKILSTKTTTTVTSGPMPKLVSNIMLGVETDLTIGFDDVIEFDNHKWNIVDIEIKPNALNKMRNVTILKLQRG